MALQEIQVALPADLVQEIDEAVGVEKRGSFLAELARSALQNHRILRELSESEPIWKDEDHPDLAALGTQAWVRKIRQEDEERFIRVHSER